MIFVGFVPTSGTREFLGAERKGTMGCFLCFFFFLPEGGKAVGWTAGLDCHILRVVLVSFLFSWVGSGTSLNQPGY